MSPIRNAMSVDVEDWFQVQNYAAVIPRGAWDTLERRVEARTLELLDLFATAGVQATFFTLGWVAERHPRLVRRILADGHELASHGYGHERVFELGAERFRADLRRAKAILEDAAGTPVIGYRAPTFSLSPSLTPWAYPLLAETGHRYSSSVFPGRHAGAGEGAIAPFVADGGILEIPMTVLPMPGGRRMPVSGGGWFRLTPHAVFVAALRRVNAGGRRGIFYVHPWEVDPGQPRVGGMPWLDRRRHFTNLHRTAPRLARLCREFAWGRMDKVFGPEIEAAATPRQLAA